VYTKFKSGNESALRAPKK